MKLNIKVDNKYLKILIIMSKENKEIKLFVLNLS